MIGSAVVLLWGVSCSKPEILPAPTQIPPSLTSMAVAQTPSRTPLPIPGSPEFPAGRYFHTHSGGQLCVFKFNNDGTTEFYWMVPNVDVENRVPYETGTYKFDQDQHTVTFGTTEKCQWSGTYRWAFDGQFLFFQSVGDDKCPDRQQTFEKLPYTKVD